FNLSNVKIGRVVLINEDTCNLYWLEMTIQDLKTSLRKQERDYTVAQKEIVNLQKEVAVLLKECRDVQLRCRSVSRYHDDEMVGGPTVLSLSSSGSEDIISERLVN
ncbi:Nuclear-pore anchor, partial [Striga hermonthica]